jgi:hypothetical protein
VTAILSSVYKTPGVYVEEVPGGARPIDAVGTSTVGFVGRAPDIDARVNVPTFIENFQSFVRLYAAQNQTATPLALAVRGFFDNGGRRCCIVNEGSMGLSGGSFGKRQGLDALEEVDEVAIVCVPGHDDVASYEAAIAHCEKMKNRIAILDGGEEISSLDALTRSATAVPGRSVGAPKDAPLSAPSALRPRTSDGGYAAFYVPHIFVSDPFGGASKTLSAPPCGHVAGIYSRTDATRGVHKAPANEVIRGALGLKYNITAIEQGSLNEKGVNVLRMISGALRVWGARTLAEQASPWRYVNVRRTFMMIEESIQRGTAWVVFEPNDETLWKSIRRDIRAFLEQIYRSGALVGRTPDEAFYVKCDAENNPPDSVDAGFVVVDIGIAVVRPAEFIVFRIGQHAERAERTERAGGRDA